MGSDMGEEKDVAADYPEIVSNIRGIARQAHRNSPFDSWKYDDPVPEEKDK
ncbi:hypothetical protein ACFL6S_03165 [Candidatus Poribacteria bacterium]